MIRQQFEVKHSWKISTKKSFSQGSLKFKFSKIKSISLSDWAIKQVIH